MSQKTSEFEPTIRRLKRQVAELMHKDTDLLTVVTELAFTDTPVSDPTENEWETQYGYRPMLRAFDCKGLAGFTTTELSEYPEPHCAWHDRLSDRLTSFITQSTKRILAVAHNMGNSLGMRELEPTDKSDCSNRSQQRYITEKAKDVTDALCQIVFPAIDLDRPDAGTQYADTAFLDLQSYLGLPGTAANQGSRIFDEEAEYCAQEDACDVAVPLGGTPTCEIHLSTIWLFSP